MGRHGTGWKIRQRAEGHAYAVRFWIGGREYERSTGERDARKAASEAAKIYADAVARAAQPAKRRLRTSGLDLEEVIAQWVSTLTATLAESTAGIWEIYANTHWLGFFDSLHHLTDGGANEYMNARLRLVKAETVRKELSALRHFCKWCVDRGYLPAMPKIPHVPKRSLGTAHPVRRRAAPIELSPEECEAIIAELPEWSNSSKLKDEKGNSKQFPIKARFLVGYETGLRTSTLDALVAGVHYRKGSSTLLLTSAVDKNRWGREIPLSARARAALDAVCPAEGLIFGKHEYRPHLWAAAEAVLPPGRAELFAGCHLRSAMITHRLEAGASLPGVQYLAGHKLTSTTARYVRPSLRAALDVIKLGDSRNTRETARAEKR